MNAQLRWIAAPPTSLAHAAAMQARGLTLVDTELAQRLAPLIAATDAELQTAQIDRNLFWANLVPASAGVAPFLAPDIARRLLEELSGSDASITSDELLLRAGPLRDAWEARGPGLWRSLCNFAREPLPSPMANVVLVRPALGGGGAAFPAASAVSFEAMLANPQRELPEIVRLAWLFAQVELGCDAALALIPPLLAAAEDVELARCDLPTMATAMRAWHLTTNIDESKSLAEKIAAGWHAHQRSAASLRQTIAALR